MGWPRGGAQSVEGRFRPVVPLVGLDARPLLLALSIVAMLVSLDVQRTVWVRSCVVASVYVPVAMN